jgi:hypothetical protein
MFPMAPGASEFPTAERLYSDSNMTAFEIKGAGVDDVFILCESGCPEVMVDDIVFEGRALLVRRGDEPEILCVGKKKVEVGGLAY